jgi:hypothetical protein
MPSDSIGGWALVLRPEYAPKNIAPANMVNRRFTARRRIRCGGLIYLLRAFFSIYSTNIKRFALMLAGV